MGHRDGIEHVTNLPGVLEIHGVDRFVSLPTLWRPIGLKKYLKGLLVARHQPPPALLEHNALSTMARMGNDRVHRVTETRDKAAARWQDRLPHAWQSGREHHPRGH